MLFLSHLSSLYSSALFKPSDCSSSRKVRATLTCHLPTKFQEIQNCDADLVEDKEVKAATAK
jgi:hypothetical protein